MNHNQQQKEIATIKPRTITLNLSDADCERIAQKAGSHSMTVAQVLENFIGDLVGGTHSNGSDERDYAVQWFDRCCFGMFPENTLLNFLLDKWQDFFYFEAGVHDFVTAWETKQYSIEHPEEFEEERAELEEGEKMWFDDEIDDTLEDWEPDGEVNMEEQIDICRKWLAELKLLKGKA